jgi:selenocysteine-specific elongation factor
MHVVATAGHVDHGKSALVRALTGMEPDRWAEEQRRGLTIDLGFAWVRLPEVGEVAFVDVPGHERFVTNMLAGVGPVAVVLLVVAADEGWQPQTEEHVRAVDALGVRRGLLVVTKADLADPAPVLAEARERLAGTGLRGVAAVSVSARTGAGLDEVRAALARLTAALPAPDPAAPVRLWVDRAFTITGAGTVVTGTLAAGSLRVGDELRLEPDGRRVAVRGLQSLGASAQTVRATARVAVNLRGVDREAVRRGDALTTADAFHVTDVVDVTMTERPAASHLMAHLGSAAVSARAHPLGDSAARLQLDRPLPLHLGDRLLLRDPTRRTVVAADVADLAPLPIRRRGDAARVGASLAVIRSADDVVARHRLVHRAQLLRWGCTEVPVTARVVGDWYVDPAHWRDLVDRLSAAVREADELSAGVPVEAMRRRLALPVADLVLAAAAATDGLEVVGGHVRRRTPTVPVPAELAALTRRLAAEPFAAPDLEEVRTLDARVLAHGVRSGLLLHLGGGVYVAPNAPARAVERLADLAEPFTAGEARAALGTSRRVVIPLLEHLDAARLTRRLDDGRRVLHRTRG